MKPEPLISIVIPNWNGAGHLECCLQSLESQTCPCGEVIVVDNASTDGSVQTVARVAPGARILRMERNLGFAAAANAGIAASRSRWVAILNNDTEVTPSWVQECASAIARHPEAAFLACRILDMTVPGRVWSAGDCFLRTGIGYRRGQDLPDCDVYQFECEIFSASGCAALYRKDVLQQVQGFDHRFFAYLEDVDLGLRLRAAGHRGVYIPSAVVRHRGGATSGGEFSALAVRLRTRNSILMLMKSVPARILWRCAPMIMASQAAWAVRALVHGRMLSYIRGLAGAVRLAPAVIRDRRGHRPLWHTNADRLWRQIVDSEALASRDYAGAVTGPSLFMKWYFRLVELRR